MSKTNRENGAAEIISIGDELLIGQVINSNASWMGEHLFMYGIPLRRVTTIGDSVSELHQALDEALGRVQFVFLTGGLGPTSDDITKPALCSYFDVSLVYNRQAYEQVEALFARRGMRVTERNMQQAYLPSNCTAIENSNGTAPGMWFEQDDAVIVSMPGVPFEMKPMLLEKVIPEILRRFSTSKFLFKTVMTMGVGESMLADRIKEWENALPAGFKLAYLPQPGIVRLRIGGQSDNIESLQNQINELVQSLCKLIPEYVYGFDNEMPEEALGKILVSNGLTISTAESCTGGYLSHLFTSIPGSSRYFVGSVVAYDNMVKEKVLGVSGESLELEGAVSEVVAKQMATGVRNLLGTDLAIATTGIAGPDGGSPEKPVGTVWIAIAGEAFVIAERFQLGEHRERNIRRAALTAFNMLRSVLKQ